MAVISLLADAGNSSSLSRRETPTRLTMASRFDFDGVWWSAVHINEPSQCRLQELIAD
jgi:hypothetical protein